MKRSSSKVTACSPVFFVRSLADEPAAERKIIVRQRAEKFARNRQWERLRNLLVRLEEYESSPVGGNHGIEGATNVIDHDLGDVDDERRTILHVLVAHQPPLDLVERLDRLVPSMTAAIDSDLATPLHVAVACDASHDVVRYLVEARPGAASRRDANGKTPLMRWGAAPWREGAAREGSSSTSSRHSRLTARTWSTVLNDDEEPTVQERAIVAKVIKPTLNVLRHIPVKVINTVEARNREGKMWRGMEQRRKTSLVAASA